MKILNAEQIRELDQHTIQHEAISSIALMERAAKACADRISALCAQEKQIAVFCGRGNNGGDGLAIARLLLEKNYKVVVYLINDGAELSQDAQINCERLQAKSKNALFILKDISQFPETTADNVVAIDALFGTGMNRPAQDLFSDVIKYMNARYREIISIDIPSGLFADQSSANNKDIVRSSLCLTFQAPKLAILFPSHQIFVPEFEILDIGLDQRQHNQFNSNYFYVTINDIRSILKHRPKFSHKGNYGHALLVAGSKGKSGAAVIAAKACLRSGAGLLTVHSTNDTLLSLAAHLPEAMSTEDKDATHITELGSFEDFQALAFGPGIGTHEDTALALKKILNFYNGKLILDADGLNLLSENKTWLSFLHPDTILTPHPKEFERLTEKTTDDFERLSLLKKFSLKHQCIVVLKGAHTAIAMPDGNVFFNSSGNAGLAKGGSGDALTGIILGLLARGYNAPQAALIGTFVHGLAADLCAKKMSMESILISDVIEKLPEAFHLLENS